MRPELGTQRRGACPQRRLRWVEFLAASPAAPVVTWGQPIKVTVQNRLREAHFPIRAGLGELGAQSELKAPVQRNGDTPRPHCWWDGAGPAPVRAWQLLRNLKERNYFSAQQLHLSVSCAPKLRTGTQMLERNTSGHSSAMPDSQGTPPGAPHQRGG